MMRRPVAQTNQADFLQLLVAERSGIDHEHRGVVTEPAEAVELSLACGAGVNLLAEAYPARVPLPAMNTTFLAANDAPGVWVERCKGCGDCILHLTAGICPVARCAKNILNGPCGGTHDGKCEISSDEKVVDCVWAQIVERLGQPPDHPVALPFPEGAYLKGLVCRVW